MEKVTLQRKLATVVRIRREALKYSQESFADAIGMHRAYYSSIERGTRNITLMTLERVATGLGTTIAALAKQARI